MRIPELLFVPAPKTPRLSREVIITEKVDGAWGAVVIDDSGEIFAASRNRWITPEDDNYCFAHWVEGNKQELLKLGPGRHPGEWFGLGIQRNYDLKEKRFSLFNAQRWDWKCIKDLKTGIPGPACCSVVPILYQGDFTTGAVDTALALLKIQGSQAAPGFMDPEGVIIYHTAARMSFKKTLLHDDAPKSLVDNG